MSGRVVCRKFLSMVSCALFLSFCLSIPTCAKEAYGKSTSYINYYNGYSTQYIYPEQSFCFNVDASDGYYACVAMPKSSLFSNGSKVATTRKKLVRNFSGEITSYVSSEVFEVYPFNLAKEFDYDGQTWSCRFLSIGEGGFIDGCPYYSVSTSIHDSVVGCFAHCYEYHNSILEAVVNVQDINVDLGNIESDISTIKQYNQAVADSVSEIDTTTKNLSFDFVIDQSLIDNIQKITVFVTLIWFVSCITYFGNKVRSWRNYVIGRKRS